jgi:SRSO17 transposase
MVNFVSTPPKILTSFLDKFRDVFTRPAFFSFSVYVSSLFLELKRTNIQSIASRNFNAHYENLQYFISEAKWDEEKLNNCRIQILQSNRTTKTCKKGVLVIDDTSCKKWGFKTEGAQVQLLLQNRRLIYLFLTLGNGYAQMGSLNSSPAINFVG